MGTQQPPLFIYDLEVEMCDARRIDGARGFQFNGLRAQVLEQVGAAAQEYVDQVKPDFVQQSRTYALLCDLGAADDVDISVPCSGFCLVDGALNAIGYKDEGSLTFRVLGRHVVGQNEYRDTRYRVASSPTVDKVICPPTNQHSARSAGCSALHQIRVVDHTAVTPNPIVQLFTTLTERLPVVVVGPGDEPVERHRYI
jgi:hypothetical protein